MKHTRALAVCAAACFLTACTSTAPEPHVSSKNSPTAASSSTTPEPPPTYFTISSAGDILLHLSVNDYARSGHTYDYTPLFDAVKPWIEGSDLALCSLEVPVVPAGEKPSNYPSMGSPAEIVTSLKALGWDGCALATNHTMDRGYAGIKSTIATFDAAGIGRAGTGNSQEDANAIQYYTLRSGGRDVTVAHLSATTLTNGYPLPRGHEYAWNVVGDLGRRSVDDLIGDAQRARIAGADLVVVSMHWGTEYVHQPIEEQTRIANQLAASGTVDLVFGNHSHVAEPVAKINGGPDGRGMWVVWSMGNMISGQTAESHGYGVLAGLITTATVEVPAHGNVHVTQLDWTGITQDDNTYRLFPLSELVAGARPAKMTLTASEIAGRAEHIYPVMAGGLPERTTAPTPQAQLLGNVRR